MNEFTINTIASTLISALDCSYPDRYGNVRSLNPKEKVAALRVALVVIEETELARG